MTIYGIMEKLHGIMKFESAKAHCDIPCGIYDPAAAQLAALTVIRMADLMSELAEKKSKSEYSNSIDRYVRVKEDHAERCKNEVRVIWGDYFKPEHFETHPELNQLVHDIMKQASDAKHGSEREKGLKLLDSVNKFAEIFWSTKRITTKKVKAPYEVTEVIVIPEH